MKTRSLKLVPKNPFAVVPIPLSTKTREALAGQLGKPLPEELRQHLEYTLGAHRAVIEHEINDVTTPLRSVIALRCLDKSIQIFLDRAVDAVTYDRLEPPLQEIREMIVGRVAALEQAQFHDPVQEALKETIWRLGLGFQAYVSCPEGKAICRFAATFVTAVNSRQKPPCSLKIRPSFAADVAHYTGVADSTCSFSCAPACRRFVATALDAVARDTTALDAKVFAHPDPGVHPHRLDDLIWPEPDDNPRNPPHRHAGR